MKVSLIVTTYNWPSALEASLRTAIQQNCNDYEVIVADDGSGEETSTVVRKLSRSAACPIIHVWHEDKGFRAAMIRNRAVAASSGDYLIFIDGDCLLYPDFIKDHVALAETGYFVPGSRVKLKKEYTGRVLGMSGEAHILTRRNIFLLWLSGHVKRFHPIIRGPRKLKMRYSKEGRWDGAVTCNMAVWRQDFLQVNGFDNSFVGWGLEDSDLVVRLMNLGVKRKEGKLYSFVVHLNHAEASREMQSINRGKLEASIKEKRVEASCGFREIAEAVVEDR